MCLLLTRLLSYLREYSQETYIKEKQDVETKTSKLKEWLPLGDGSGVGQKEWEMGTRIY